MSTFSDTEITAAVEDVSPQPSALSRDEGALNADQEFDNLRAAISETFTLDPDSVLYLLLRCKEQIITKAEESITELADLTELLESVRSPAKRSPEIKSESLAAAKSHLKGAQTETSKAAIARRVTISNKRIDEATKGLDTSKDGIVYRRKKDIRDQALASLTTVDENYTEILTRMSQLDQILTEYDDPSIRTKALSAQAARGQEVIDEVETSLNMDKDKNARQALLKLSMLKALMSSKAEFKDPLDNKAAVAGVTAGTSTKAKLEGTATAPFRITPASGSLTMTVDDVSKGVWPNFPNSTQAEVKGIQITANSAQTVEIVGNTAAELKSDIGTFDLTRVQVTDVITVSASKPTVALLPAAVVQPPAAKKEWAVNYPTVAVGDILWLTGPRRIVGIEGSAVFLDSAETPATYTNKYVLKDNRFYVTVDGGVPQELAFPYASAPPSTYAATGSASIAAAFNITGATDSQEFAYYKLVSNTQGATSMLAVGTTAFSQELGLAGDSDFGTDPNNVLNVEVDGVAKTRTVTVGSHTVAALATDISNIVGATCVTHTDGTGLTLHTDTYGPPGTMKILTTGSANDVLGFIEVDILQRGVDVTLDQIKESLKADYADAFEIDADRTDRDDPGLGESTGSNTLEFSSADQVSGVEVNDILLIEEGDAAGSYKVTNKAGAVLTVESNVVTGNHTVIIYKEPLTFTSKVTTTSSALKIAAGGAEDILGLPTTESRGVVKKITLTGVDFSTMVFPPVRKADKVSFAGQDYSILELEEPNTLTLSDTFINNASGTATVKALGAFLYSTVIDGVATWNSTLAQSAHSDFSSGLVPYTKLINDTVDGPKGVGIAIDKTAVLSTLLTTLKDTILAPYEANVVDGVDDGSESLKGQGLDRAADILEGGNLKTFFAMSALEASYKSMTLASIAASFEEFGLSDDVDEDDLDFAAETSDDVDAETDFSDTVDSSAPPTQDRRIDEEVPGSDERLEIY